MIHIPSPEHPETLLKPPHFERPTGRARRHLCTHLRLAAACQVATKDLGGQGFGGFGLRAAFEGPYTDSDGEEEPKEGGGGGGKVWGEEVERGFLFGWRSKEEGLEGGWFFLRQQRAK